MEENPQVFYQGLSIMNENYLVVCDKPLY